MTDIHTLETMPITWSNIWKNNTENRNKHSALYWACNIKYGNEAFSQDLYFSRQRYYRHLNLFSWYFVARVLPLHYRSCTVIVIRAAHVLPSCLSSSMKQTTSRAIMLRVLFQLDRHRAQSQVTLLLRPKPLICLLTWSHTQFLHSHRLVLFVSEGILNELARLETRIIKSSNIIGSTMNCTLQWKHCPK